MLVLSIVSFFCTAFSIKIVDDKMSDSLTFLCVGANFLTIWYGFYYKDKNTKTKKILDGLAKEIDTIESNKEVQQ